VLAKAESQIKNFSLTHRFREQARSHRGLASGTKKQAVKRMLHGLFRLKRFKRYSE